MSDKKGIDFGKYGHDEVYCDVDTALTNSLSPDHYTLDNGKETIEIIQETLAGIEGGFESYCVGNIIKYITRYKAKNGIEDLDKAMVYLLFLRNRITGDWVKENQINLTNLLNAEVVENEENK